MMCSRRFYPTLVLSVALCCCVIAAYYWVVKETVDGNYTDWSAWGNCSRECGEGNQFRRRTCENPAPGRFGKDCYRLGASEDKKPCFLRICPMDGKYGAWSEYSKCDKTCGGGRQIRTRKCNNPPAAFGGKNCEGPPEEAQICNTQPCPLPVNGGFTDWSAFSACSVTCGQGTMKRDRSCSNPPPSNGGRPCDGPSTETASCDKGPCPVAVQKPVEEAEKPEDQADKMTEQKVDKMPEQQANKAPDQTQQANKAPDQSAVEKTDEKTAQENAADTKIEIQHKP